MTPLLLPDLDGWATRHEVIVAEGCDGVGKTTLAVALATGYGYTMVHATRTPDGVDVAERYRTILAWPGPLVLDRSFISELVYGPMRHGRSRLSLDDVGDLVRIVTGRGGIFMHLTGPPELIAARLRARDGHAPELSELRALITAYTTVFEWLASYALVVTIDAAAAA
jgi:thymidylate kinase